MHELNIFSPYRLDPDSPAMIVCNRTRLIKNAAKTAREHSFSSGFRKTDGRLDYPGVAKCCVELASWAGASFRRDAINYVMDTFPPSLFIYPSLLLKANKSIIDFGDIPSIYWETFYPRYYDRLIKFSFGQLIKNATYVVPRGYELAAITEELLGQKINVLDVIYDPVEQYYFECRDERSRMKKKLRDSGLQYVLGYVGSIRAYRKKNEIIPRACELLNIFMALPDDLKAETAIIIIGGGPGLDALRSMKQAIIPEKYQKNIILTGRINDKDMKGYMAAFDAGYMEAHDSLGYRAMIGYKVQQYLALGIPVLTPHVGERKKWGEYIVDIPLLKPDYSDCDEKYFQAVAALFEKCIGKENTAGQEFARKNFHEKVIQDRFMNALGKI